MSVVNLTIRNTVYQIACDNGQEAHLEKMSERLNKRLNSLSSLLKKGSDNLLLVMVALMMEDEIEELKKSLSSSPSSEATDTAVAKAIDNIAAYVETIAKNLEKY